MIALFVVANVLTLVAILFVIVDTKRMGEQFRKMKTTLDGRTDTLNRIEQELKENREHIDRLAGKQVSMDLAEIKAGKLIETAEVKAAKLVADQIKAATLHVDKVVTNGKSEERTGR